MTRDDCPDQTIHCIHLIHFHLCLSAASLKCFISCGCVQVPFPELHGEFTEYVGRAEDAIIAMSNYRLHIKFKESVVNVSNSKSERRDCASAAATAQLLKRNENELSLFEAV